MTRGTALALALGAALAGCGVDGPPVPPSEAAREEARRAVTGPPTIAVGGRAEAGIAVTR